MARQQGKSGTLYTPQGKRKYLNADERQRFLATADTASASVRALCLVLAYLGLRISEALALCAADVQVAVGTISVQCLKKRNRITFRELPAPEALLYALDLAFDLAARQRDATLSQTRLWPISRVTAWRVIKRILDEAGVIGGQAMPKGLRHGFGVHAVQCAVPLPLIQRWLGHTDLSTTSIYTHVLGPEERAIARRMWASGGNSS